LTIHRDALLGVPQALFRQFAGGCLVVSRRVVLLGRADAGRIESHLAAGSGIIGVVLCHILIV